MRIALSIWVALIAFLVIGCTADPQPRLTELDSDVPQQAERPMPNVPVEADESAPSATDDNGLDLSDLDDIGPVSSGPLVIHSKSARASQPGLDSQHDLGPLQRAVQVASRSRDEIDQPPLARRSGVLDPNLPTKIELREARRQDLQRVIDGFEGNVVFVDFWATWCGPCVRSFPQTVRMHELAHQHDLRVITVSLDKPFKRKSVLRFLEAHNATCVNLLAKSSGMPVSYDLGIPGGGIPHFKLYDRQGKQRYDWTGSGADVAQDIKRRVVELLRET